LHLAENKADPEFPFAFLATVANRVAQNGRIIFSPLGKAVKEAEAQGNRARLLALLEPLARAEKKATWLSEIVASREVFHPLAWNPSEAFAFLSSIPDLETSGLQVKVPNWWARNRGKVQAKVTVGQTATGSLNAGVLLSFDVGLAIGDDDLTNEERAALFSSNEPFVQIRGQWIEVNKGQLQQALQFWNSAAEGASEGLTWAESLRLLSGFSGKTGAAEADLDADLEVAQFSRIVCGADLEKQLARLRHPEADKTFAPGLLLKAQLRPYQEVGVSWLGFLQELGLGACLADDMGLGKTIQVIALLLSLKRERGYRASLLVAPASLLANWLAELSRFAPSLVVRVAHPAFSQNEVDGECDLCLTTYGQIVKGGFTEKWDLIILDEAQAIKNPSSQQTQAVKNLKGRCRIALTGTPIENRLSDLWSLFDFLNPGLLGSAKEFKRYANGAEPTLQSLQKLRRLIQPYILRRLKSDKSIIADLPEKTEMTTWCTLSKKQAQVYANFVDEFARKLESSTGVARKGLVLAYLTKFKQVCNHADHALGFGEFAGVESGKYARLAALCEEIASRQEKVIVFTQYQEMCAILNGWLGSIFGRTGLVLDGSTPIAKRKKLVDAFQTEDGPPYFVLSLKAGGTGLNLTAASHVIHFDRWWNPAVENQATDRAFRIGQRRNVLVHKFVCRGTLEERIDLMIEGKKELASAALGGGGEVPLTEMSNHE
jgi:non-specific serine/threonine protein kinase